MVQADVLRRIDRLRARMEVSADTARFLLELLDRQQLSVGAPDFEKTVALVVRAQQELRPIAAGKRNA